MSDQIILFPRAKGNVVSLAEFTARKVCERNHNLQGGQLGVNVHLTPEEKELLVRRRIKQLADNLGIDLYAPLGPQGRKK